jgi:hypothetical protein
VGRPCLAQAEGEVGSRRSFLEVEVVLFRLAAALRICRQECPG